MTNFAGLALDAARTREGCPYVWGAEGPSTFDCSGLVDWSYNEVGFRIPRTTANEYGDRIVRVSRANLEPGMLIQPFPGHIQIYAGGNRVIEAPKPGLRVRIVPVYGYWKGGYFPGSLSTAAGSSSPYPGRLIAEGATGAAVHAIQAKVGVTRDGIFGPKTKAAVEAFQRRHGLQVDGIVGPKTWRALFA